MSRFLSVFFFFFTLILRWMCVSNFAHHFLFPLLAFTLSSQIESGKLNAEGRKEKRRKRRSMKCLFYKQQVSLTTLVHSSSCRWSASSLLFCVTHFEWSEARRRTMISVFSRIHSSFDLSSKSMSFRFVPSLLDSSNNEMILFVNFVFNVSQVNIEYRLCRH